MRVDTVGVISCNGMNKFFCIPCVERERASGKEVDGGRGRGEGERAGKKEGRREARGREGS